MVNKNLEALRDGLSTKPAAKKSFQGVSYSALDEIFNNIKISSIGDIISYKKISDEHFSFKFDFECECFIQNIFNKNTDIERFLKVDFFIDINNQLGFGGAEVSLIFGKRSFSVDIEEKHMKTIVDSALNVIFNEMFKSEITIKHSLADENNDTECNKINDSIVGLDTISNYMYDLIKGLNESPDEEAWKSMSYTDKEDIAKELQSNLNSFVDLMNHFELKSTDKCSDDTINTISEIIKEKLSKADREKEAKVINKTDSLIELKAELDKLEVKYNSYKYLENKNSKNSKNDILAILDAYNNECMWVSKDKLGYKVFDGIKRLNETVIFQEDDVKMLQIDNFNDLINLITKISQKVESTCDIKEVEENHKVKEVSVTMEDIKSNDIKKKPMSKKEFRREFLLNHLDELSDEDLLNELRRRMSSK